MTDEKVIHTTMQGEDRRAVVEIMHQLLERLRTLPDWGDRTNGLLLQLPNGGVAEITGQIGQFEAFKIEVRPKPGS